MTSARYAARPLLRRGDVASAVATGVVTLVDPGTVPPRLRPAYRLAVATVVGAGLYTALEPDPQDPGRTATRGALAFGAGGLMYATMPLWERVDAAVSRAMRRLGVSHPRLKLAVGGVVASLAVDALDGVVSRVVPDDRTVQAELSPGLVAVAEAILSATDEPSAAALRAQLHHARAVGWGEVDELDGHLDLDVGPVDHWVVPHDFTFPVRAEFEHGGHTFAVRLRVDEGRLSAVLLEQVGFDPRTDPVDGWPTTWPAAADVRLRHDRDLPTDGEG